MKKIRIVSFTLLMFVSASVMAVDIKNFSEDFSVCISPGYNCSGRESVSLEGGSLTVAYRYEGYDKDSFEVDYKIEITNHSDCKVQIGVMELEHGSKRKMIDWGLIEVEANDSETSRKQSFYMSKDAAGKYEFMYLKFSGLAHCPD